MDSLARQIKDGLAHLFHYIKPCRDHQEKLEQKEQEKVKVKEVEVKEDKEVESIVDKEDTENKGGEEEEKEVEDSGSDSDIITGEGLIIEERGLKIQPRGVTLNAKRRQQKRRSRDIGDVKGH